MRVITAIDKDYGNVSEVKCFLAGGISSCPDWQAEVIDRLSKIDGLDRLVLFNPRRQEFPIGDPSVVEQQILWEFERLQICDLFSMFFCGGDSLQPICMYELGRNVLAIKTRFPDSWHHRLVLSCDTDYKRQKDVQVQMNLATGLNLVEFSDDYHALVESHVKRIVKAYRRIVGSEDFVNRSYENF